VPPVVPLIPPLALPPAAVGEPPVALLPPTPVVLPPTGPGVLPPVLGGLLLMPPVAAGEGDSDSEPQAATKSASQMLMEDCRSVFIA